MSSGADTARRCAATYTSSSHSGEHRFRALFPLYGAAEPCSAQGCLLAIVDRLLAELSLEQLVTAWSEG